MNPERHPPLTVLCIIWGEKHQDCKGRIEPLRLETEQGKRYYVKEVRHHTQHRQGKALLHQFVVRTKEDHFLEIWLDMHTLNWCITEEQTKDGIVHKY